MLKSLRILIVTGFTLSAAQANAQAGMLDTSFGTNGTVVTNFTTAISTAEAVAIESTGKIVVAGSCYEFGTSKVALARYNMNGTLDTSFGTNGIVKTQISVDGVAYNFAPRAVALQNDKIIVAGTRTTGIEGNPSNMVAIRFTSQGTIDTTFGENNSGVSSQYPGTCSNITLASNGKILLGGTTTGSDPGMQIGVLLANGTTDISFSSGGQFGYMGYNVGPYTPQAYSKSYCTKVLVQPDGKIMLAGYYSWALNSNKKRMAIIRINPATAYFDNSFNSSGVLYGHEDAGMGPVYGYHDQIHTAALQSNGKIVLAGFTEETNGSPRKLLLMRVNADGTADTTFGLNGMATYAVSGGWAEAKAIHIETDGKIVVGGMATGNNLDFMVARFQANGTIDTSFGTGGVTKTHFAADDLGNAMAVQADGKLVVAGSAIQNSQPQFALARYNSGGAMGVEDSVANNTLMVYPNPVKDILTIKGTGIPSDTSFSLYSLMGQRVHSGIFTGDAVSIDMSGMASGIYMLAAEGMEAMRIVKE